MNTNEPIIPVEASAPSRVRVRRMLALGAAAIVTVASLAAVVQTSRPEPAQPAPRTVGLTMDQKLQLLVERWLIPRQALEPAPLTMDQRLQSLVDRGLIPRQALEEVPDVIIFGPAHPLGAPDTGIPCSDLVYTRC